jgi:prepilin-type N-terminal cleavage/methylation domain-containing protein
MLRNNKGFSMVEVIIVIGLFSIIALIVFNFMGFGLKSFSKSGEMVDDQAMVRLAANTLSDELRTAQNITLEVASPATVVGESVIYLDSDKILVDRDGGQDIGLPGISSILFTVDEDDDTAETYLKLDFTIVGVNGFSVDSSVYLLNYNIDGYTGTFSSDFPVTTGSNLTYE